MRKPSYRSCAWCGSTILNHHDRRIIHDFRNARVAEVHAKFCFNAFLLENDRQHEQQKQLADKIQNQNIGNPGVNLQ